MFKSAFGNETPTIVFATLENPGSDSRNFPVGLVRDFRPFWRFFASSQKEANYRPIRVKQSPQNYFSSMQWNLDYRLRPKKFRKNHVIFFLTLFCEKNVEKIDENFQKIDDMTLDFTAYSHLTYIGVIYTFFCIRWSIQKVAEVFIGPVRNSTKVPIRVKNQKIAHNSRNIGRTIF